MEKFNLEVTVEKTQRIRFSRFAPTLKNRFTLLGFELFWNQDKSEEARLFRRTSRKKLKETMKSYSVMIKKQQHTKLAQLIDKLTQKLRGHYNYFGDPGNMDDLYRVYHHVVGMLYKWLNRRSGRKSFTWERLKRALAYRSLAKPVCKAVKAKARLLWY